MEGKSEGRRQIMKWMGDRSLFKGMLKAGALVMQDFDRTRLNPMYARVGKAIRLVDGRHILFLEPAMSANLGFQTAITPLVDDAGKRDPQQAYAPHVYDIVVDTDALDLISHARIDLIVQHHKQFSHATNMPMLVGEWGAFYLNPAAEKATRYIVQQFDKAGCGDMFWAYKRNMTSWVGMNALKGRSAGN
jgi:endoglycosylceramidase